MSGKTKKTKAGISNAKKTKAAPVGRPSKYKKRYCQVAFELGKQGNLPAHIANHIGVGLSSVRRWMEEHEEFRNAMERAKQECEMYYVDQLGKDPTHTQLAKVRWILSAYFRVSETVKQEIEQTNHNSPIKVEVSFADRGEGE